MTVRSATKIVHHIKDGPKEILLVDANSAVARFPEEWSETPWSKDGKQAKPMVEIPADWQDRNGLARIAIAVSLGNERKGMTASKADDIILAEVEKRAADAEAAAKAEEAEAAKPKPKAADSAKPAAQPEFKPVA
jgi:hypothetical protein